MHRGGKKMQFSPIALETVRDRPVVTMEVTDRSVIQSDTLTGLDRRNPMCQFSARDGATF